MGVIVLTVVFPLPLAPIILYVHVRELGAAKIL